MVVGIWHASDTLTDLYVNIYGKLICIKNHHYYLMFSTKSIELLCTRSIRWWYWFYFILSCALHHAYIVSANIDLRGLRVHHDNDQTITSSFQLHNLPRHELIRRKNSMYHQNYHCYNNINSNNNSNSMNHQPANYESSTSKHQYSNNNNTITLKINVNDNTKSMLFIVMHTCG